MRHYFSILKKQWYLQLILIVAMPALSFSQGFSSQTTDRLQHVIDSFQNNAANPYVGGMSAAIKVEWTCILARRYWSCRKKCRWRQ